MEARLQELEEQVAQLLEQRNDLYRDIETLCVAQNDGSCWSASAVLMQRAIDAERQNERLTAEKAELQAEKATLLNDVTSLRASKRQPDVCCREQQESSDEPQDARAAANRRHSRASCEKITLPEMADDPKDDGLCFSDLQTLYKTEIQSKDEKLKEAAARMTQLEDELASLANAPDVATQLKSVSDENRLLQRRIKTLEGRLEKANEELELVQDEVHRSEHHVSMLLDQLEKAKSESEGKGSRKSSKKSRTLQKKLDRLSVDLTKAFSKIQLKDEALSETEAEMDCMKKRHRTDMTLVREAYDRKSLEMKKLVAQKDETIQALQHSLELLELEKTKLMGHITRRDHVLSKLRHGRWRDREDDAHGDGPSSAERDQELEEHRRKTDGMEAKIKMLERTLHHVTLKQEAMEKQKNDALLKASAYKKRYIVFRARMQSKGTDGNGTPLLERNLRLHNISTQCEEALRQARAQSRSHDNSRPSSRLTQSRTESFSSRHSQISLAQFALLALVMQSMGKQRHDAV